MLKKAPPQNMRIHFHAVHWEEFMQRERDDKMSNGLLTRALMNDEPLPWRRMEVDVDTDVDPTWLAATARYVRRLRGTGILTLYAYTTPYYSYVLDLLRGGTRYTELALLAPADLQQDRSGIARAGVWKLWAAEAKADAKTRGAARTLESTLPQDIAARVRAHLAAKGAIDRTSEESAERGFAAWNAECDALLDAARPHVDARFWTRVRMALAKQEWQWSCVFAHAARALRKRHLSQAPASRGRTPLSRFKAAFPYITAEGWRAILVQYVADLDALFARAPPLPSPVVVFRGTKRKARQEPRGAWYASTSMRREVAEEFANKESPMVLAVDVPRGARPLPLCMVSRYPPEVELLLPKAS